MKLAKKMSNHNFQDENANFGHFRLFLACLWPVFGLSWPQNKCSKLIMSIFVLDLTGMSEITKKNQNNNGLLTKMEILAILGHFWPVFGQI